MAVSKTMGTGTGAAKHSRTLSPDKVGASPILGAGVRRWRERLYDRRAGWMDGTAAFAGMIAEHIDPGMRLLDLGAGDGKPGPVNFRGRVREIVGIDVGRGIASNRMVDDRVVCDAEALPFRAESFHLAFSDWVVEHFADPARVAAELIRVLRPGGRFLFRTGNRRHYVYAIAARTPQWFHAAVANRVRALPADAADPHRTFYRMNTSPEVRAILGSAGFVEEELRCAEFEPSYLQFSVPSFLLGVAYERLVNWLPFLAGMRACLLGCFVKPTRLDQRQDPSEPMSRQVESVRSRRPD